jgi:hypothetical protein
MLDLGPIFIDKYIREVLKESISCGIEKAIIDGTGNNEPIGLNKDVSKGVTVTGGVYPKKTAVKVNSFTPKEYGKLLSKLVTNEDGKNKTITEVTLICNQIDYLTKIIKSNPLYLIFLNLTIVPFGRFHLFNCLIIDFFVGGFL